MQLVLHYRGPLRANGDSAHKHQLRQHFHPQLKKLWSQKPLNELPNLLEPRGILLGDYSLLRTIGAFTFVPLINAEMNVVAELSITLLRAEPPGGLITQGGDMDNRLKTLFDALTMPVHANQLPSKTALRSDQQPLFCLLEDDNLVTTVSVRTEQLLEPDIDSSLADVTILIRTRITRLTMGNAIFG